VNPLQFADLFARLRGHLESAAACYADPDNPDTGAAVAAAFLHVLDSLAEVGATEEAVAAVAEAANIFDAGFACAVKAREAQRARREADREADQERREAAYEEAVRRHRIAVRAECPYCGAAPGVNCHTAGPSGHGYPRGIHAHADRYRAAVGVLGQDGDR
jgi:hypothetical protein